MAAINWQVISRWSEPDLSRLEIAVANLLGYPPGDRVQPTKEDRPPVQLPETEDIALASAYESSKALKLLESKMQSKRLEVKSYRSEWIPQFDLVAQYALLAHYNYADSFRRFQPNNGQLGVSFKLPLLVGPAGKAYASQGEIEIAKMRVQVSQSRTRIQTTLHQAYRDLDRAESAREVVSQGRRMGAGATPRPARTLRSRSSPAQGS